MVRTISCLGLVADAMSRTTLLPFERKAYTNAVLCLMSKPSRLAAIDPNIAPGAKTLYDDFVAVHMNVTFSIHATVLETFFLHQVLC
jgi:hypothetical protein